MQYKVACLFPIHKNDDSLKFYDAVKSIILQNLNKKASLTLFFCCDGSLKESHYLTINNVKEFLPTKIIYNKYDQGLANNLNSGLEEIMKEDYSFIFRMDADDISLPNRVLNQLNAFECDKKLEMCGSWSIIINDKSEYTGLKKVPEKVTFKSLQKSNNMVHPSVMFKKEFFRRHGFYDPFFNKSQDWEFWLRASKNGAVIGNIQKPLIKLRIDSGLMSRRKAGQHYNRLIIQKYLSGINKYKSIIRTYIIEYMPYFILKIIVSRHYKKDKRIKV